MNVMRYIDGVTTNKSLGPRGRYYDWCSVREDGFVVFGDEQGNYSGGVLLSPEWYPEIYDCPDTQTSIDVGKGYWYHVRLRLDYWHKRDNDFYRKIKDMLARNGVTVPGYTWKEDVC